MLRRAFFIFAAVVTGSAANPTAQIPLQAQNSHAAARPTPVAVALVDRLPDLDHEYAAVIMRVAEPQPHDIILIPRATASGELLDAATRTLLHSRALNGDRVRTFKGKSFHTMTIGVRMNHAPQAWAHQKVPLAQKVVDRLQRTQAKNVEGIGTVPLIEFYPPRKASAQRTSGADSGLTPKAGPLRHTL